MAIEDGKDVQVLNCFSPEKLEGDAKTTYQDLLSTHVKLINNTLDFQYNQSPLKAVMIDAIFGTGLTRDIDDDNLVEIIDFINRERDRYGCGVLSIDIPSGLNADTGNVMNAAVNADVTATFMARKRGMFTNNGC